MVCGRCISSVENIFTEFDIPTQSIVLGEVETSNELNDKILNLLEKKFLETGFERIKDATHQLIDKIKNLIITKISTLDISEDFVLSQFITNQLNKEYSAISKSFSQNENYTLEQFFILQKIEKVKELLLYDEFNLSEIATKLGYKTVQHLSSQFKNTTGFTPTEFKKLKISHRKPLDKV